MPTILSEPNVDKVSFETMPVSGQILISEYLPGQYDQRADSAAQCCQLLTGQEAPLVRCAAFTLLRACSLPKKWSA